MTKTIAVGTELPAPRRGGAPSQQAGRATRILLLAGCAIGGLLASAPVASAQTAVAAQSAATTLSDMIVTARQERHEKEFNSIQTTKVLDQDQIKASSVVGGVAKALALVPGVSVSSYGATGSTKTTISIDGIKLGWAGFSGGNPDNGSIGVSFDGVPMSNPGNGLWQATLVPQTSLLQTMAITYGPGDPAQRWYTNIGGGLNFVPLQPSAEAGGTVEATYGSFGTQNYDFSLQTGDHHGWETVVAAGFNYAHNYITAPDGFDTPGQNYAVYVKTRKQFDGGDFSLGFYTARSGAYRPLAIPVSPIAGVSINGYNQPGPLLSQQTTGFYETLPRSVNYKFDSNAIKLGYGALNLQLSDDVSFHNLTYIVYENRVHWTPLHDYVPGSESREEINKPHSFVIGDKPTFDINAPFHNDIEVGGYLQYSKYHSREQLYNPDLGFVNSPVPVPAGLNGSAYAPNGQYFSDIFEQVDSAVFVQDTFKPISTLSITPGIRYVYYVTDFTHDEASEFPLATLYNPGGQLSQFPSVSKSFTRSEPSIGVNWQPIGWMAIYGSWARAYRQPENGGGTGPYVAIPASAVELERGDYYQAGVKLRWPTLGFASDVSVDASYYHLNFDNETIPTALASGGALLAYGSSVYQGANIFADGSLVRNLYLFVNAGIVNANFTSFTNGSGTFHNVPVPNTPGANFNIGAYYKLKIDEFLIQPRISYQYTGAQHLYDNGLNITSADQLPSFGVVNLSAAVNIPTNRLIRELKALTVTLEIDNLLNKEYNAFEYVSAGGLYGAGGYSNPTVVGAGSILALPAPPRAFYVTVGAKF